MLNRILFVLFATFWITMNVLLYRTEFRSEGEGSPIPVEVVVEKILRAPDLSTLEIRLRGKRVGFARVLANIGEEQATGRVLSENAPLEGEIRRLTGYTLDIDGGLYSESISNRQRFFINLQVSTNQTWQSFTLQLTRRPQSVSLYAESTNQTLNVTFKEEELLIQQTFTFDELRQPKKLLGRLGVPLLSSLVDTATGMLPPDLQDPRSAASRFQWKASNDRLRVGQGSVRVYRLEAEPIERQKIVIIISRVGEILKVELPHGITMVNDEMRL